MPTLTHVTISLSGILTPTPPDSLLRADEQPYVLTEDNRAGPRVGFGEFGVELCFVTVDWQVRESGTDGRLLSGYWTGGRLLSGYRTGAGLFYLPVTGRLIFDEL